MKTNSSIRFKGFTSLLAVSGLLMAFALVGFTKPNSPRAMQYQAKTEVSANNPAQPDDVKLFEVRNSSREFELLWEDELAQKMKDIKTYRINGRPPTCVINVDRVGKYIKDVTEELPLKENDQEQGFDLALHNVTLGDDGAWINPDGVALTDWTRVWACRYNAKAITNKRIYLDEKPNFTRGDIIRIVANEKETRITYAATSYWDWCWRFTSSQSCMIDRATGDRYMIRSIVGDEEVGRLSILEGTKGKWFEHTEIYPPLKKGVMKVDLFSPANNIDVPVPNNRNMDSWEYDVDIKMYSVDSVILEEILLPLSLNQ